MLRRLLASALFLGSAVALSAPSANAQSVDVTFSGTLGANCTFSAPTPGVLSFNSTVIGNINPLNGFASVTVSCSAPANLTISAPIQTTGPTLNLVNCRTLVDSANGSIISPEFISCNGSSPPISIPTGGTVARVTMLASTASIIPPGTYGYKVTLTIVP